MNRHLQCLILVCMFSISVSAQPCSITADAGIDQTVCANTTTSLNGSFTGTPVNFFWTPTTGLDDPNSLTPTATLTGPANYTFHVQALDNTNLLVNGDFENGNTGFTSNYSYVNPTNPVGLINQGSYTVIVSPSIVLNNAPPCDDHTFGNGTGLQMVVNGDGTVGQNLWCQTVNLTPGDDYYISAWMTNYNLLSTPSLQFTVDGTLIGQAFSSAGVCDWQNFGAGFNAGTSTTAEVCLTNQWSGLGLLMNDFGLDDFSLTGLCTSTDDVSINVLDPQVQINTPAVIDCNSATPCINLTANPSNTTGSLAYQWTASNGGSISSGANSSSPQVCSAGDYSLIMTETSNGLSCDAPIANITVLDNDLDPPIPSINGSVGVCDGDIQLYDIFDDPAYTNILWVPPTGATIISGQGTNTIAINYAGAQTGQLCVFVENACANTSFSCVNIDILGNPALPIIGGATALCAHDASSSFYSLNNLAVGDAVGSWTVPTDATILSGQGTEVVMVDWSNSAGGDICVEAIGLCGSSQNCLTVTIYPSADTSFITQTTCDPNAVGLAVQTLLDQNNCDSILVVNTILALNDTTEVFNTSCDPNQIGTTQNLLMNQQGCDSLIITTTTLLLSDTTEVFNTSCDPNQIGSTQNLLMNQQGCDSLIITTTTLLLSDTTEVFNTNCDPNQIGTTQNLLMNQQGCDSLIITTTTLLLSDTTEVFNTSCDPNQIGTTQNLFMNQQGCDSLIITTTTLLLSDTTEIFNTSCDPNQIGSTQNLLMNQQGCDSLIITTTTLLLSDTTEVFNTICDPNQIGSTQNLLMNQQGCDSLIITTTTLLLSDTTEVFNTSCDSNQIGTTQNLFMNQQGCDSLIITTTTLLLSDTTEIFNTSCDPNQIGSTQNLLMNQQGCDSLIITTTTLLLSDTTEVFNTNCDPNQIGTTQNLLMNQQGCDSLIITTTTLLLSDTTEVFNTSCDSNQIGTTQNLFMNQQGCDSLIITTTTLLLSDTTEIFNTSCDPNQIGSTQNLLMNQQGCDSLVITTTTLLLSDTTEVFNTSCDPNQIGTTQNLLMNQQGCDSLIITTTTLLLSDTTEVFNTSCDPNQIGTTQNLLMNQQGCDSLVITTTTLLLSDTTEVFNTSCDPNQIGTTQNLLMNQQGCDSLIITTTTLLLSDTTEVFNTSCDPNQIGTTQNLLMNQQGCDSLVITTTTLLLSDTTEVFNTNCDPNQIGSTQNLLMNQQGCDSLVITTTTLLLSDTTEVFNTSCDPNQIGTTQNLLMNQQGCDSLVIITTTLLISDTIEVFNTSCDPNQVGSTQNLLSNQQGCDSLVITTTTLLPSDTTEIFNTSCDPAEVGLSTISLSNQWGCDSLVLTLTTLLPIDSCSISSDLVGTTIPCSDSTGSLLLTVTIGQAPFDYQWEGTGNNPLGSGSIDDLNTPVNLGNLSPGNYSVTVSSPNGFSTILTAQINQEDGFDLQLNVLSNYQDYALACSDAAHGVGEASITNGGQAAFNYLWSSGETNSIAQALVAGWNSVTVTDANGCQQIDSLFLSSPPPLSIQLSSIAESCFAAADGQIQIDTAYGGVGSFVFAIDNQDFQAQKYFDNLSSGVYEVTIQDSLGCAFSSNIIVQSPPELSIDLGDDLSISLGEEITLQALTNIPLEMIDTVIWNSSIPFACDTCLEQIFTPYFSDNYSLLLTDKNGCLATDEVYVEVVKDRAVFIPNAFSPNGDGTNDRFTIYADKSLQKINRLHIYTRWGEEVFKLENILSNDHQVGWDGSFKGEVLNPGVYLYWAELLFIDGEIIQVKGEISLVR